MREWLPAIRTRFANYSQRCDFSTVIGSRAESGKLQAAGVVSGFRLFGNKRREARLNEAARAADAFACSKQAARRFETALEELSASRYDEAIGGLGFMVRSMNLDLKVTSQVLFFPMTSKPKSIEIP